MLSPILITPPATQPVSLAQAKAHCRVDHDDHNDLIDGLIKAATAHLDGYTGILGRALVTQTWRQDFCSFSARMGLPLRPVASITSVTYFDGDNATQTLGSTVYGLFSDAAGAYVALKLDQGWPGARSRRDAVSVTYVVGAADADVPASIKQAILLMVGHWYANREAVNVGNIVTELPLAVDALLRPYRTVAV